MTAEIKQLAKTMRLTCDCPGCKATRAMTLFYREHEIDYDGDGLTQEKIENLAPVYDWTCVLDENTEELLTYCPEHRHMAVCPSIEQMAETIRAGWDGDIYDMFKGNLDNIKIQVSDAVDHIHRDIVEGYMILITENDSDDSLMISTQMGVMSVYMGDWKEPKHQFIGQEIAQMIATIILTGDC